MTVAFREAQIVGMQVEHAPSNERVRQIYIIIYCTGAMCILFNLSTIISPDASGTEEEG